MSFYSWKPYVPVAERRRKAAKKLAKMRKDSNSVAPVVIAGRTIAKSFWGKAWCDNLERYSDYENRLPRGRTYVRNGSVLDLQIAKGEVVAMVSGSELYTIKIAIAPVEVSRWQAICSDCSGSIDSLVELLQGKLAKGVMERVCRQGDGLFPAPGEIKLACSCPDWADMCKHVAAVLYGVGARLDASPEMLFVLRGVDEKDLVAGASGGLPVRKAPTSKRKLLADEDVAALFGLDMAEAASAETTPGPAAAKQSRKLAESAAKPKAADRRQPSKPKPPAGRKTVTSPASPARGKRPRSGMLGRTLRS